MSVFLSVDPHAEKYPNINPYVYVANNPINAIDPDGRDVIRLNGKGSITKVVNDGKNHITINDMGTTKSLSNYAINGTLFNWNNRNRQVVANIAGYYANKLGIKDVGATYKEGGMAHYRASDDGIWIAPSSNGSVDTYLNDKYNLMNTLIHEQKHRDDNAKGITNTHASHAEVYIHQMADESFKMTTEGFQQGMVENMLSYILGVKKRGDRDKLIDDFNNSNSAGFEVGKSYKSGYGWEVKKNNETKYLRSLKKSEKPN